MSLCSTCIGGALEWNVCEWHTLTFLCFHSHWDHFQKVEKSWVCLSYVFMASLNGCKEVYRVYNSFYYHIKRRHATYLANGRPPKESMAFRPGSCGGERFDIPIFSNCMTPTRHDMKDSSEATIMQDSNCFEPEVTLKQDDHYHNENAGMSNQDQGHIHAPLLIREKVNTIKLSIKKYPSYLLVIF